jgi:hypothetical protein
MEPMESNRDMDSNTTSVIEDSNDIANNNRTSSAIVPTPEEDDNHDIVVNLFDVLLGRGKGMDSQYGNQKFQRKHCNSFPLFVLYDKRTTYMMHHPHLLYLLWWCMVVFFVVGIFADLVRCNAVRYIHAPSNEDKRIIIMEIINDIQEKGRFLKQHGRSWIVVNPDEVRKKVAHAIQYYQRTIRKVGGSWKKCTPISTDLDNEC